MDARPKRAPGPCAVALALFACGAAAGLARAEAVDGEKFKDWTVKCEAAGAEQGQRCILIQNLTRKDGEDTRVVMSTVVGRFGEEVGLAILFTVPLGVFLPAGLVLQVDDHEEAKRLDYQFCMRSGCRAAFRLDDRWLGLLKAGRKATITVENGRRKQVALPISLLGLTKGLAEVAAQ